MLRQGWRGLICAGVLVLAGCASPSAPPDTAADAGYSDEVRSTFTQSCVAEGNATSYCECALDGFEAHFTEAEMVAINNAKFDDPGWLPAEEDAETILAFMAECDAG